MNYMLVLVLFHHLVASHTKDKCLSECQAKCGNEECFECEEPFCPSVCPESLCDDEPYGIPWEPPRFPAGTYKFCSFLARAALGPRFDPRAAQPDWLNRQCGDNDGSLQCRLTPPERAGNTAADDWTQWNHAEGNSCYHDWDRFECYNKCMGWCEDACTCTWAHDSRQHRCEYRFTHEWTCACANVCTCQHGVPVSNGNCTCHGANICRACYPFFHLDQDANCKANICKCDHGTAVFGAECLIHGVHECVACDKGYHLGELPECIVNVCYCANGTPQSPGECLEHSTTDCSACNEGYHPVSGVQGKQLCEANVCMCENGTPQSADACSQHNATECATCNKGYHTVGDGQGKQHCEVNVCYCANGSPQRAGECLEHSTSDCSACNDAYHPVSDVQGKQRCEANVCMCENGTPESADACSQNNATECATCNKGYHTVSDGQGKQRCEVNVCYCANGFPQRPGECLEHSTTDCSACNDAYHPVSNVQGKHRCEVNVCVCENGTPHTVDACSQHNATECSACNKGYHTVGNGQGKQSCEVNVCYCANGSPQRPGKCLEHSTTDCSACDDAYHPVSDVQGKQRCEVNVCVCENGTPLTVDACSQHNATECSACNKGYHTVSDRQGKQRCEVNVCYCANGFAQRPGNCLEHGTTECSACNDAYHPVSDVRGKQRCEVNECYCANGSPQGPGECLEHNTSDCSSCNEGYHSVSDAQGKQRCEVNVCLCANGTPHSFDACLKHNTTGCSTCNKGYLPVNEDPRKQRCEGSDVSTFAGNVDPSDSLRSVYLPGFENPGGMEVSRDYNLYVADKKGVRLVAPNGTVSTLFMNTTGCTDVALDRNGNAYVTDGEKHSILFVNITTRRVSRVAGNGLPGFQNRNALDAKFNTPAGIALHIQTGEIYVADAKNHCIRLISGNEVTTLAGSCTNSGFRNGPAHEARFYNPLGIALERKGSIYVCDAKNHAIRFIFEGIVHALRRVRLRGFQHINAQKVTFNYPSGIMLLNDTSVMFIIIDSFGQRIRLISLPSTVVSIPWVLNGNAVQEQLTTLFGGAVLYDRDNVFKVYAADPQNHRIFRTEVDRFLRGFSKKNNTKELGQNLLDLVMPLGVAVEPRGTVYVSDYNGVHLIAPNGAVSSSFEKRYCQAIAIDVNGNVLCSDQENHSIDILNIQTGLFSRIAGNGRAGFQNGHALSAKFSFYQKFAFDRSFFIPAGVALDTETGSIYVADASNHCIRIISDKQVSTAAGSCTNSGFRDGAIHEAMFYAPSGIVLGLANDIYVSDVCNNCIRRIRTSLDLVDTFARKGTRGFQDGNAQEAMFNFPTGIALDSSRVIYVTDNAGTRVRCVWPTGAVTTLTGTKLPGFLNGDAAHAQFGLALGIAVGLKRDVYVGDCVNRRIRRIQVIRRDELVKNDTTMPNEL